MAFISATNWDTNTNTGTQSVTVPANAKLAVLGLSGFSSTSSYWTTNTLTIGGAAMTVGDSTTNLSLWQAALLYKFDPATGAQDVIWDWAGTGATEGGCNFTMAFWDDDADGVRDTYQVQAASGTFSTDTMTAQSGDLQVGWCFAFIDAAASFTWTTATERSDNGSTTSGGAGSFGDSFPSGNQAISCAESGNHDGGIIGIVFTIAGGAAAYNAVPQLDHYYRMIEGR